MYTNVLAPTAVGGGALAATGFTGAGLFLIAVAACLAGVVLLRIALVDQREDTD